MSTHRPRTPVLNEEHAAFIQSGVSVIVAARDAELVPDVVRGCGCRISRDRRRVTVLVESARAATLLDDIRDNGMIAVVFSQPSTHRTIQIKGTDARLVRLTAEDRAIAAGHHEAWIVELTSIGYRAEFASAVHGQPGPDMVAIAFTPTSAFQQTPGPGAGERLQG